MYELEYGQGSVYGPEEEAAVLEVIRAGAPGCGPKTLEFERAFADYIGAAHGVAVSSGTAALQLAMTACGIGPGDEVITTPLSWMSTANAAAMAGAAVVFGDVDRRTFTLDPDSVARKITPRTRAIVPVHLYGHCAEMDPLLGLARKHGLRVIEDCAHAPGAEYKGRRAGSMGDLGCFSFGTQKNMTTLGEGGMVVTNDAELERRVRSRRWICAQGYGAQGRFGEIDAGRIPMGRQYWRLEFDEIGGNLRMTDIQAAAGLVQLRKLDALTERRRAIAARYGQGLGGIRGLVTPSVSAHVRHVYHVYAVLIEPDFGMSKEDFMWELRERKGITPWSHYMPIHLTAAYRKMGHAEGECPVAESLFERYVSLPLHPRLTDQAVEYLIRSVRELALERAKPIQDCLV